MTTTMRVKSHGMKLTAERMLERGAGENCQDVAMCCAETLALLRREWLDDALDEDARWVLESEAEGLEAIIEECIDWAICYAGRDPKDDAVRRSYSMEIGRYERDCNMALAALVY